MSWELELASRELSGHSSIHKPLYAVALRLPCNQIPLRIDPQAVQVEELARLAAGSAEVADLLERRPIQDRDALVGSIGDVQESLLRIRRERDAKGRPGAL